MITPLARIIVSLATCCTAAFVTGRPAHADLVNPNKVDNLIPDAALAGSIIGHPLVEEGNARAPYLSSQKGCRLADPELWVYDTCGGGGYLLEDPNWQSVRLKFLGSGRTLRVRETIYIYRSVRSAAQQFSNFVTYASSNSKAPIPAIRPANYKEPVKLGSITADNASWRSVIHRQQLLTSGPDYIDAHQVEKVNNVLIFITVQGLASDLKQGLPQAAQKLADAVADKAGAHTYKAPPAQQANQISPTDG